MFKGRHFDQSIILLCVRWYLAYGLSLRDLKEMMSERGFSVDHSTIHRWVVHFSPLILDRFNRRRRAVTGKWHADETYIKVQGQWRYLYRAIDSVGDTVDFWFSQHRDLTVAKRFFTKAIERHGRPQRIVIDGSQTNREAIISCDLISRLQEGRHLHTTPIRIRQSQYLDNRFEQDHRRIKRRVRPMLGLKALSSATTTIAGIEMVQMMRKRQAGTHKIPAHRLLSNSTLWQMPSDGVCGVALSPSYKKFATEPQDEDHRGEAFEIIRSMIDRIEVSAGARRGDASVLLVDALASILDFAAGADNKKAAVGNSGSCRVLLVARAGLNRDPTISVAA